MSFRYSLPILPSIGKAGQSQYYPSVAFVT